MSQFHIENKSLAGSNFKKDKLSIRVLWVLNEALQHRDSFFNNLPHSVGQRNKKCILPSVLFIFLGLRDAERWE
jgi:hypothetical protein